MSSRPLVQSIVETLLARHAPGSRVDLNDVADVIAGRAVSYDEVDEIVSALEESGRRVGEPPTASDVEAMRAIVLEARSLSARLGRRPTVAELAEASGQPEHAVRRALENAARAASGPAR